MMQKNTNNRGWFYLVLVILPLVILLTIEGLLRLINYGENYSTFVVLEEISDQYFLNPTLPNKFFSNTKSIPSVIPNPFDKEKDKNTIRIFVFGGSTTAGYPYSENASFPAEIKRKLELYYPTYKIEMINLGVSAVNSHFIRSILPDVLEKNPDLLLMYAGHNEFYGALGPASNEFIASNPAIVQWTLALRDLKIYQLLQNSIRTITSAFSSDENASRKTLMAEIIKEQNIASDSEIYRDGINQYKENIAVILEKCKASGVPIIVGNLASNLKQKPLQYEKGRANELFDEAVKADAYGDSLQAKILYQKSKDEDLLKFRATEDFNDILLKLADEYDLKLIDVKGKFERNSPGNITGNNLMVDHLHPNIKGYRLMGDVFFLTIDRVLNQKFSRETKLNPVSIDNYLLEIFPFTRYDSTLSDITISVLLNDFPFKENPNFSLSKFPLYSFEDTLAMQTINNDIGWAAAHLKMFDRFLNQSEHQKAAKAIFALMEARPFYKSALTYSIPKLLSAGLQNEAKHILVRNYRRYPDLFTSKTLGAINLNQGNTKLAQKLFLEAARFNNNDPEIHFNLSRIYFAQKDLPNAIESINKCLQFSPDYRGAKQIKAKLEELLTKNNY